MYIELYSDYYEKKVVLTREEADILVEIYSNISEDHGFEPEVAFANELSDVNAFDHVAYHVDSFGENYDGFEDVKHLFE